SVARPTSANRPPARELSTFKCSLLSARLAECLGNKGKSIENWSEGVCQCLEVRIAIRQSNQLILRFLSTDTSIIEPVAQPLELSELIVTDDGKVRAPEEEVEH